MPWADSVGFFRLGFEFFLDSVGLFTLDLKKQKCLFVLKRPDVILFPVRGSGFQRFWFLGGHSTWADVRRFGLI